MPSPSSNPAADIKVLYTSLEKTAGDISAAMGVVDRITAHNDSLATEANLSGAEPDVVGAITSFLDKWSYGLKCIKSDGDTLAKNLGAAGAAFQRVDSAIANALPASPPGQPPPGHSASPPSTPAKK